MLTARLHRSASSTRFAAAFSQLTQSSRLMSSAFVQPSTTSSGSNIYESRRAVDEYLQMHFGAADEVLPYDFGPADGLNFPERCAKMVASAMGPTAHGSKALDVGCAVGGASFALAQAGFTHVDGVDFSNSFIDAAKVLQRDGEMGYTSVVEGTRTAERIAAVPEAVDRARCSFAQGDACSLESLRDDGVLCGDGYDAVLASNLLCRLPSPRSFLKSCADWAVRDGGVLVLVTPFSWLEEYTSATEQIPAAGDETPCTEALEHVMLGLGFELAKPRTNIPFLIREHARKFQWGVSEASVWVVRRR